MHHDEMWQVYAPNGEAIPGEGWDSALGNPEVTDSDVIELTLVNGFVEFIKNKGYEHYVSE